MSSPLLIVRHAVAVEREKWHGDDALRPLTPEGERQAENLAGWLAGYDPAPLLTSPTERCVATLRLYAAARAVVVVRRPELHSDHVDEAISLARRMLSKGGLLCSHGEVIEPMLAALAVRKVDGPEGSSAKGAVWVLEPRGETVVGRYFSPEAIARSARERLHHGAHGLTEE